MSDFSQQDRATGYGFVTVLLHWLIALLIVAAFALGTVMVEIEGLTPTKLRYFSWHKWLGITILALTALRLLWRLWHRAPPYAHPMPRWQLLASKTTHGLLYVLMFILPLSGYFYSLAAGVPVVYLGIWPLPVLIDADPLLKPILEELHEVLSTVLLIVVSLHVLAALKHQFVDRDNIFKRILP
jgi:cytochrome b561